MVRFLAAISLALPLASALEAAHWCGGVPPPSLASNTSIDVYFAQAPLFSTQWWGPLLKYFNLFHAALVLHDTDADQYWTLEFDMVSHGWIPTVTRHGKQGSEITWHGNEARWCLWAGIYNGRDHWKTFDNVATIKAPAFAKLFTDFVEPLNQSLAVPNVYPTYNPFFVKSPTEEIQDVTCGTGVSWVLDYIAGSLNVPVKKIDRSVSRVTVNATALDEVDLSDEKEWCDMVNYFELQDQAARGNNSVNERFSIIDRMLPQKYAFDANRNKYYKLRGDDQYFEVEKEEMVGLAPVPAYACKQNCEPPTGPAVFCSTTTTTTPAPQPSSHQNCQVPGDCGVGYQTCCIGFGAQGYPCDCHLQDAGNGKDGKGGHAGGICGDCGLAYAECCTAFAIQGFPCGCDVELPAASFLSVI